MSAAKEGQGGNQREVRERGADGVPSAVKVVVSETR
jgi:hypothetical protein